MFTVSVIVAKNIRMIIRWNSLALILFMPIAIALVFSTLNINYIIGITSTIIIVYLLLMKINIILKEDIKFLIGLFPDKISKKLMVVFGRFEKVTDWFYD